MREYFIFLVKHEVALEYFGKEPIIFSLFKELRKLHTRQYQIARKQVEYITRIIPFFQIQQFVIRNLRRIETFTIEEHQLEIQSDDSRAQLLIKENYLILRSSGTIEAETIFFEVLRKFDSCFLAINYEKDQVGWLNPIKQTHLLYKNIQ